MATPSLAFFDLPSGLSGDMFLSCLVDCGWPIERLRQVIESLDLPTDHWAVQVQEVRKGSLRATQVNVLAEETEIRRNLSDITTIISNSSLPESVKAKSLAVFTRLAAAEAKVHGTAIEQVHFHEVGAIDSIIDVVGCVSGLAELGIDRLYASAVPLGQGWTDSAHGPLPLPSPATLELLATAGAPTIPAPGRGELLTPTGAALLAELATFEQPKMNLSRIGVGAGQRDFAWPNIARLWMGTAVGGGPVVQMETNIDDMNPQLYANVSDKLFAAGARDVWLTPVQMKKGRPGVVLSVLADQDREPAIAALILRETTSFGVRVSNTLHRHEAGREIREVSTEFGRVRVKLKWVGGELIDATPEYEDCRTLADRHAIPLKSVHAAAAMASQRLLAELLEVDLKESRIAVGHRPV